jgi:hypothetical protein
MAARLPLSLRRASLAEIDKDEKEFSRGNRKPRHVGIFYTCEEHPTATPCMGLIINKFFQNGMFLALTQSSRFAIRANLNT